MTRLGFTRPSRPRSTNTSVSFAPTVGFTENRDVGAPLGSITSGQNCWVHRGTLEARDGLTQVGATQTHLSDAPTGYLRNFSSVGTEFPVVASAATVQFFNGTDWSALSYVGADALSGTSLNNVFGDDVYLQRNDENLLLFTNNVDGVFAWESGTAIYSSLTGAPIARDISTFDERPLAWNITDSSGSLFVNRVQWPVRNDPEDWTGLGSGHDDLVYARGAGTRIFAIPGGIILATTKEIWQGEQLGGEFVFRFSVISDEIGIPFAKAAIQTSQGIFFLGDDYNIYRLQGQQLQPVPGIRDTLRRTLSSPATAFFLWHAERQQLFFIYDDTQAFAFDAANNLWTPHAFAFNVAVAGARLSSSVEIGVAVSSAGTTTEFSSTVTDDDGTAFLQQAVLAPVFTADPSRNWFLSEQRLEVAAASASSLSLSFSTDFGGSYSYNTVFALSANSNSSQIRDFPKLPGPHFTPRIESLTGAWSVRRITPKVQSLGEAI